MKQRFVGYTQDADNIIYINMDEIQKVHVRDNKITVFFKNMTSEVIDTPSTAAEAILAYVANESIPEEKLKNPE